MATLTLTLDDSTLALLQKYANDAAQNKRARTPATVEGQALRFLALGLNKDGSTRRHAAKDRAVRAGSEGITFKRYEPLHAAPVYASPETDAATKDWAAVAPHSGRKVE